MNAADDYRALRHRVALLRERRSRELPAESTGAARMLGRVFDDGAMPSTVPGQFAVHPMSIGGPESEGAVPTLTPDTAHAAIFTVLGPGVPGVGDNLVGRLVGARWVARRGQAGPCGKVRVTVSACGTNPAVGASVTVSLGAHSSSGLTNASGYFDADVYAAGVHTVVISKARYQAVTLGPTYGCVATNATSLRLLPDAGHVCCNPCADPLSTTLHVTDGFGVTTALSWLTMGNVWEGWRPEPIAATGFAWDAAAGNCTGSLTSILVPIRYTFSCLTTPPALTVAAPICPGVYPGGFNLTEVLGPFGFTTARSINQAPSSCDPLLVTFTADFTGTTLNSAYPGSQTFTLTE